ncbi:hypothetical protein N7462_008577 [Penicillium macrosclerotiorum]|uniref:uncharacterized protein n=1 Tax=Penicillium macrosclerotiorum TaxID=303699 RepID=UPI002549730E|nr:uncharacterized protein N7462_008577 [Penicillium macrosclerotiorum]KAJ5675680.1 hypothetical protein N7462_008577 [Penicillium macrosclerotiorum]
MRRHVVKVTRAGGRHRKDRAGAQQPSSEVDGRSISSEKDDYTATSQSRRIATVSGKFKG